MFQPVSFKATYFWTNQLRHFLLASMLCLLADYATSRDAWAWEPETTHAGLAETSAMDSTLHSKLGSMFGETAGLFSELGVPQDDAPDLHAVLKRHSPLEGFVPDSRGVQTAMAWLVAGAVLADTPSEFGSKHFYDATEFKEKGTPSLGSYAWIMSEDNPMGFPRFQDQYKKAVVSPTKIERQRHLAGVLMAAGAMHHVVTDLASPSHVRSDMGSHSENLGQTSQDTGSRFERIAALAFGRLGIIKSNKDAPPPKSIKSFFVGQSSLAEWVATHFFSNGTMPRSFKVKAIADLETLNKELEKAQLTHSPNIETLDLWAAKKENGMALRGQSKTCLARVRYQKGKVDFFQDDACMLEQANVLLPVAAAHGSSLLDYLFRTELKIENNAVFFEGPLPKHGHLSFYWDDSNGKRSPMGQKIPWSKGSAISVPNAPKQAKTIVAFFEGVDMLGEPFTTAGLQDSSTE